MALLVTLIASVVSGWLGYWWGCKRDTSNRLTSAKVEFGIAIQKQIDAVPERDVLDFYNRAKPDIRLAVITFRQHLRRADLVRIDALWEEFDKEIWKKINASEPNIPASMSKRLHELARTPYNPETNQDRLKVALTKLHGFSM